MNGPNTFFSLQFSQCVGVLAREALADASFSSSVKSTVASTPDNPRPLSRDLVCASPSTWNTISPRIPDLYQHSVTTIVSQNCDQFSSSRLSCSLSCSVGSYLHSTVGYILGEFPRSSSLSLFLPDPSVVREGSELNKSLQIFRLQFQVMPYRYINL